MRVPGWFARHKALTVLIALVILLWGVGQTDDGTSEADDASVNATADDGSPAGTRNAGSAKRSAKTEKARRAGEAPGGEPGRARTRDSGVHTRPRTDSSPAPGRQRTFLVTRVIDGDTIELGNGETVRLVGIDTPEVGECGFEQAGASLERLVLHRRVTLGMSDEDRDGYGRLLRYVDVGRVDAGLRLIRQGRAIARYDSRDGYGYHPREPRYIAADRGSQRMGCAKPATLMGSAGSGDGGGGGGGGGGCAPGYSPCVPPAPPDLDCADVDGPVRVSGSDPHGLDADGDGVACES